MLVLQIFVFPRTATYSGFIYIRGQSVRALDEVSTGRCQSKIVCHSSDSSNGISVPLTRSSHCSGSQKCISLVWHRVDGTVNQRVFVRLVVNTCSRGRHCQQQVNLSPVVVGSRQSFEVLSLMAHGGVINGGMKAPPGVSFTSGIHKKPTWDLTARAARRFLHAQRIIAWLKEASHPPTRL